MALHIANTFVTVADDCQALVAIAPVAKGGAPTVASIEYALLSGHPYTYTLEDLIFEVHLARRGISARERAERGEDIHAEVFARPHACMRASPLTKTYGWGAHYDAAGRIAIFPRESLRYAQLAADPRLDVVKAMRNKRA